MLTLAQYTQHLSHDNSALATLVHFVFGMPVTDRKVLLKACRIQGPFSKQSRLYTRHKDQMTNVHYPVISLPRGHNKVDHSSSRTIYQLIQDYSDYFSDPICCGYISMLLRYIPYSDYTSVVEEKDRIIKKELEASQGGGLRAPMIDYHSLSSPRFHPYLPGVPGNLTVITRLRGSIRRLSNKPIVPRLGKKKIPLPDEYDSTYRVYEKFNDGKLIQSLEDVERVFVRSGQELSGRTKMKTVWRGNDLKPRVYYSRGASLHRASTYIQQIFNAFVDAFETTHRHARHATVTLKPTEEEILLIYDYSSFTSQLSEIIRFTDTLADWFGETYITVLDPHHGPTEVNLGHILRTYNETCNISPEFDASEIADMEEAIFNHNCGMLGVPGNISSCTLLHGIHLMILVSTLSKCKVVGDDAIAVINHLKLGLTKEYIAFLGAVAIEKMEEWEYHDEDEEQIDERFDYKKRPLNRVGNTVLTGFLIDFPPVALAGLINPHHRHFPETVEVQERKAISSFSRFFDNLAQFPGGVSELAEELVSITTRILYRNFGFKPSGGRGEFSERFYPPISPGGLRYLEWIHRWSDSVILRLPKVYVASSDEIQDFHCGLEFNQTSDAFLSYCCKMGWLEDCTEWENVAARDLVDYFGAPLPRLVYPSRVRRYVVSSEVPYWFVDMYTASYVKMQG